MSNDSHIWVDGYICHAFGPSAAENYHARLLLMRDSRSIHWRREISGPLLAFVAPSPDRTGQVWTIDYMAKDPRLRRVIRQHIFTQIQTPHVQNLQPPMFFVDRHSGDIGLPLIDAVRSDCMSLSGAEKRVYVGQAPIAQIGIWVS
jgi:hypothetical protein